jgi:hypothetical protein
MQLSSRKPFEEKSIRMVPSGAGIYVIYDLAGPIYVGRSSVDIQGRLRLHFRMHGNRNVAWARQIGAGSSLTFAYCCMPVSVQREVEAVLIRHLGVASFANLRREACPEDWPIEWTRLATQAAELAFRT